MVDVVGFKAGADQLLEQIGFLVRALGRAEARDSALAKLVVGRCQALCCDGNCFLPACLAEIGAKLVLSNCDVARLGCVVAADQRLGQAARVRLVVKAKAAFHAQAVVVGGTIAAIGADDRAVLDVIGDLAANTAERTAALDLLVGEFGADTLGVQQAVFHQRAGGAGLDALAAAHTGAGAHGVVKVEDDLCLAGVTRVMSLSSSSSV